MAEISRADVVAYLEALGSAGLQELILELEDHWDIERPFTGEVQTTMGVPMGMPDERWLDVVLIDPGARRVQVMRAIREVVRIELQDTRALLDRTPAVITRDLSLDEANTLRRELEALGAKVEVHERQGNKP